mmetsp:Transcript_6316/g.17687  ORF Transcript_6316/g.17687 Transcript_6316/m.17687 type:complete len:289 (-) Transcript_6316:129-995(-)|eukprot:CAMPEP_0118886114 /NCGR_PEP_ID=MMETSP1163-20130328/24316_1 /TAXON_ID=124430 /ORGANISM="Phaeomonas parva, Strain CCMP2877" /LENGTH=288 /DNA_ID=CAMNT_0006824257 /DNA_START=254 /DNA_END=1120 /DNA_ORIENTATION=+
MSVRRERTGGGRTSRFTPRGDVRLRPLTAADVPSARSQRTNGSNRPSVPKLSLGGSKSKRATPRVATAGPEVDTNRSGGLALGFGADDEAFGFEPAACEASARALPVNIYEAINDPLGYSLQQHAQRNYLFTRSLIKGPMPSEQIDATSHSFKIGALHSDDNGFIAPTFSRITQTPWTSSAKAVGGYGRPIFRTSVSKDAPQFFQIREVVDHEAQRFTPRERRKVVEQRGGAISRKAPDQFRTIFRTVVDDGSVHIHRKGLKLLTDKQTIFEPMKTQRPRTAIDWGGY